MYRLSNKNLTLKLFTFTGICIACLIFGWWPVPNRMLDKNTQQAFQQKIDGKYEQLEKKLTAFISASEGNLDEEEVAYYQQLYQKEGFSFYKLQNDSLVYWSENQTSFAGKNPFDSAYTWSGNGLHLVDRQVIGDSLFVALALIKHQFEYENQFIQNNFAGQFSKEFSQLDITTSETPYPIMGKNGEVIFYLSQDDVRELPAIIYYQAIALFLGLFGLLLIVYRSFKKRIGFNLIFIALLVALRILLYFQLPACWQQLEIFSPDSMAFNPYITSVGDLFLHLLLLISILLLQSKYRGRYSAVHTFTYALLIWLGICFFQDLIQFSIFNSAIVFDLNNFFQLDYLSFFTFINFSLYFIALLILINELVSMQSKQWKWPIFWLSGLLILLGKGITATIHYKSLGLLLLIGVIYISHQRRLRNITVPFVLTTLLFALLTAWIVIQTEQSKKEQAVKLLLLKMAEENDPIAEYLFRDVQQDILLDPTIYQAERTNEKLTDYLKSNYFGGYWNRYRINFTLCRQGDSLLVNNNSLQHCKTYFSNRLKSESSMISANNLFQLSNVGGRIDYIAELNLKTTDATLYIEFSSSYLDNYFGYPELLIEDSDPILSEMLTDYSYALYYKDELLLNQGKYVYSNRLINPEIAANSFYRNESHDYIHRYYQKNGDTAIVISYSKYTFLDVVTASAYLIVIFSLLAIPLNLSSEKFPFYTSFRWTDFSTKVQIYFILSLTLALMVFSFATAYHIHDQYNQKNGEAIAGKLKSLNIEIESKIGHESALSESLRPYVHGLLIKFSNIFFTDINLYTPDGSLFSSSRQEIYTKHLQGERMDPLARYKLTEQQLASYLQKESIGKMSYFSAYLPLKNFNNETIAYLNLPYFTQQEDLQEELSSFLVSTINIYILVFAFSLMLLFLLIDQVNRPMLLIREYLGSLRLGNQTRLINWHSKDEIGELVKEYNRIALELDESARQLVQSEKEGAWREMAKQVAHEIKNPLTPMKLSVQHLQRAYEQNHDNLDEYLDKTTTTLIRQIETLAGIADAFANFAKMPATEKVEVDLLSVVRNASNLYQERISLQIDIPNEQARIRGDQDQLLRLFNNLLKNAIQATESVSSPRISITLKEEGSYYLVEVEDNGEGIAEGEKGKIFEPNFTTKSSGTGLGLAMAKSIVEYHEGSITFSSRPQEGTVFKVRFSKLV
jgi:signal transduction histidine kinase